MHPSPHLDRPSLWAVMTLMTLTACGQPGAEGPADATPISQDPLRPSDATVPLRPHCTATRALPAWAEPAAEGPGFSVACGGFRLHIRGHADGVARLTYTATDQSPPTRSWALELPLAEAVGAALGGTTLDGEDAAELCLPQLALRVRRGGPCAVEVVDASGLVLLADAEAGGWTAGSATLDGSPVAVVSVTRDSPVDERFYGLGEKTGGLDKRGRRWVHWNTDAYDVAHGGFAPNQDPLYQSIPFFIGLRQGRAYGVFTDNSHRLEFDLAAAAPDRYQVTAFGGSIDQYVVAGGAVSEVVRRYTALTGRAPLPPRWALGYHQSRWGYSPQSRVLEIADGFRSRSLPADGLFLDIQHLDGYRTFRWDPVSFPDPAGLVSDLAAQGFKLTVIADPGIKQEPGWSVYDSGLAAGAFLRRPDGQLFVGAVWAGDSVFPDFTLPAARSWWGDRVGELATLGVRGIWLDVNEPTTFPESGGGSTVPGSVVAAGDGQPTTMAEVHNVYALRQAQATYEGLRRAAPDRRPFILTRAAWSGSQRWAAAWTGDAPSSWDSLQQTLPMLLGLGLSGEPFVGSDVGGYSGGASAELFGRWMGLGAVSPFFRGHVTNGVSDQEPWSFGSEVEDISRHHLSWRYQILPYLYSLFFEASQSGAPPLRPLLWHFQTDPTTWEINDQALLGPWLLVAPVVDEGASTRDIYLPAGRWFEYESGAVYEGPTTLSLPITLAALPRYVREGAILPQGPTMQWVGQVTTDPLRVDLYPSDVESRFALYEDAGDGFGHDDADCFSLTPFVLQRSASGATLTIGPRSGACPPPARTLELRVRRVDSAPSTVTLDGSMLTAYPDPDSLRAAGSGSGYAWDSRDLSLLVRLPDSGGATLLFTYDPALTAPRPTVLVPVAIELPTGTPTTTAIHVASSADGWAVHHPLSWGPGPDQASGFIAVPRGQWFEYKYTRGDWSTVEKWPACAEADNRYGFGAAHPTRQDVVFTWRDWCPP